MPTNQLVGLEQLDLVLITVPVFSFGSSAPSISNPNSKETTPFGTQPQKPSFNFNQGQNNGQQQSTFNFGGSNTNNGFGGNNNNNNGSGIGMGGNNGGFNPSRSATPNFNFTQSQGSLDPASVFSGTNNGATPPPGRRKIMPRSMMRNRR
ncbi:unnamed protein product [Ambrosiozyma monospora]|uniref:Unnamed protein product n=1 Tax=Ambrosiozyma monospora TaxID=43982 RepID=A0ACB5U3Y8_AMBMO|nr:unnamed protein product [Ambrosiozyma monospora]